MQVVEISAPVPAAPHSRHRRPRHRVLRRLLAGTLALALLVGLAVGALLARGGSQGDGMAAVASEWLRSHGLGAAVTDAEQLQYRLDPPPSGGTPDLRVLRQAEGASSRQHVPAVAAQVEPALPGEGTFEPVPGDSTGRFAQVARVRPDATHSSFLTSVLWLSHRDRLVLHPGTLEPGPTSPWTEPTSLTAAELPGLLATLNGGFKLSDAAGAFWDHGMSSAPLQSGAASLVIHRDGHASIGAWGREVGLGSDVVFVRQNLRLLVDGGRLASNLDSAVESNWGATLGGTYAVWRSGIGITKSGDLVYAVGDALTAHDLASILLAAGAARAMQLDINHAWVSGMTYGHVGIGVVPHKISNFERPADRYLNPSSRDFVAVYAPMP